jgi:hypothetical protein
VGRRCCFKGRVGVLRLRGCFASRSGPFAQDDSPYRAGRTNASAATRAVKSRTVLRGTVPWNPTIPRRARKDGAPAEAARDGSPAPQPRDNKCRKGADYRLNLG